MGPPHRRPGAEHQAVLLAGVRGGLKQSERAAAGQGETPGEYVKSAEQNVNPPSGIAVAQSGAI